jgi:hypothetical protein
MGMTFSNLDESTISYIAGIVDGEGCIQVHKVKIKRKKIKFQYRLQLRVSNTDLRLIKYLNEKIPSYIMDGTKKKPEKSRNSFVWHVNGNRASALLKTIQPYLVCKKEQANIAIKFQETFNHYYGTFGTPQNIINVREQYIKECNELKVKEFHNLENKTIEKINENYISYFAGVLDGEGCIEIQRLKPKGRAKNISYRLRVRICNTDANLIGHLNAIFNGTLRLEKQSRSDRRNIFVWSCKKSDAEKVLEKIYPYLICKKEQAKIAIDFLKTYDTYYGIFGTPKDILEFRDKCYLDCKYLKTIEYQRL